MQPLQTDVLHAVADASLRGQRWATMAELVESTQISSLKLLPELNRMMREGLVAVSLHDTGGWRCTPRGMAALLGEDGD